MARQSVIVATAVLLLSAGLIFAGDDKPNAPPIDRQDNLLTRWLDEANIHPPITVGMVTFFPISADQAGKLAKAWTLTKAMASGEVTVEELDPPKVERARFVNRSDRLVVCVAGQMIEGGKQNRALATDALLGPDSTTELPLYCVQHGRWQGNVGFSSAKRIAPQAVRGGIANKADQQDIWRRVESNNQALGVTPSDQDLATVLKDKATREKLRPLRKNVVDKLPDNCVGVVVARGSSFVGADLFNRKELFAAMRDAVIDSYLVGEIPRPRGREAPAIRRPDPPSRQACKQYLGKCHGVELKLGETQGVGQVYELRGAVFGSVLGYQRSRMVHLHLTERIVPVRPPVEPIAPINPPRPPRPIPRPIE